jgi:nucleotide-binding universal stress UspA family protein
MVRSIIVPLDGSPLGEQALPMAMKIARLASAHLQLVHVHVPVTPIGAEVPLPYDARLDATLQDGERAYLDRLVKRVAEVSPVAVGADLVEGPVELALAKQVAKIGADLMVLTTHGRGFLARSWLGSVADELVRCLHIPILLVHPREQQPTLTDQPALRHVLIPLDGSALAEQIIEPAIGLGRVAGADYTLVRVINPMVMGTYSPETEFGGGLDQVMLDRLAELHAEDQKQAADYLDKVAERLRARSLSVLTRVLIHEQPAVAILEAVASQPIDLVAIATHGRSGLPRLVLGSVADKVLRGATVPVLMQRPTQ